LREGLPSKPGKPKRLYKIVWKCIRFLYFLETEKSILQKMEI
jgi:hypothetical protein